MYETIQQIYGEDGELIPAGRIVYLSEQDAKSLLSLGFIKAATITVPIEAPDELAEAASKAAIEARVREEVRIESEKALRQKAEDAAKAEADAEAARSQAVAKRRGKTVEAPAPVETV